MSSKRNASVIHSLLDRLGKTYAAEAGISLQHGPVPLFQLLVLSTLLSARISAGQAVRASRALNESGLGTVKDMQHASWEERVHILNENGYARYDESTSRMLGDTCEILLDKYDGDLRKLREVAENDASRTHKLLKDFKGIGDMGASIFLREVQGVWANLYPYADARVLQKAEELGLPKTPEGLADQVDRKDFPRFVAAILRADLDDLHRSDLN